MTVWILISIAAGSALFFRLLPAMFGHLQALQDTNSRLYKTLNYSSQAMLGAMCYTMAFGKLNLLELYVQAEPAHLALIALLIGALVATILTHRVLTIILVGVLAYYLVMLA